MVILSLNQAELFEKKSDHLKPLFFLPYLPEESFTKEKERERELIEREDTC